MKQAQPSIGYQSLVSSRSQSSLDSLLSMALPWEIHDGKTRGADTHDGPPKRRPEDPNVQRGNFSQEEDDAIICFESLYGNSWESIAAHLPGRTDNDVKNRWYSHLKKQLWRSTDEHILDPQTSQEIVNPWSTSELAYPEFPGGYLMSDDETIHHSFRGDYFEFEPTQLFHLNHNIDPNASSSLNLTPVSASQEITNPWSTSKLAYPEFPMGLPRISKGYLPSDDETIHHSFEGDYIGFQPHTLDFNHNIDPNASSGSISTLVSASQEIANPWSTSELATQNFQGDIFG
ncbi:Transcription factor MYB30 [Vitis vinifera]|uniref:Transcription factor MYB30 n=1 Tax=Vitis vinifera TaxID=29760 RepID=A0A438BQK3_VITVI|nr:Transcription factor MYB30 [Vitis vinifera]